MNDQICFLRLLWGTDCRGCLGAETHQQAVDGFPQEIMVAWPRVEMERQKSVPTQEILRTRNGQDSIIGMREKSRLKVRLRF